MEIERLPPAYSEQETLAYQRQVELFNNCPIPSSEILANLALFLNRATLSQLLFLSHLYEKILDVHGVIMEFGVRWGRNLASLTTLRTILEPHNFSRKIIGFDTFQGFPSVANEDGAEAVIKPGALSVAPNYEVYLTSLLDSHEQLGPRSHQRRFQLVSGDATKTVEEYLTQRGETVIALAYFDFDLFEPTKQCLESINPFLTKGSIVAFDEACHSAFPGETRALRESEIFSRGSLRRLPFNGFQSYIVIEN